MPSLQIGTYEIREALPPPSNQGSWAMTDATCTGAPYTAATNGVDVTISAGGSAVSCTFVNTFTPATGSLTIIKTTRGGTGRFAYVVSPSSGTAGDIRTVSATTTAADTPAEATGDDLSNLPWARTRSPNCFRPIRTVQSGTRKSKRVRRKLRARGRASR